tara:strand:+ start:1903 stop:2817 length:915 start_codon:yes stop_codon:yes gene_type:complete
MNSVMNLPELVVIVEGKVKESNLPMFKGAVESYVCNINEVLTEDDHFGQAVVDIKSLVEAESLIEEEKKKAIAQTLSIDELTRTMDFVKEMVRSKRLTLQRLVKDEKESIRLRKVTAALDTMAALKATLESKLIDIYAINLDAFYDKPNFERAMKGLKSLASMDEAIDKELTITSHSLILAAEDITAKLTWMQENKALNNMSLFSDLTKLLEQEINGFKAIVQLRLSEQAQSKEADREVIRQEEEAKAIARNEEDRSGLSLLEDARKSCCDFIAKHNATIETQEIRIAMYNFLNHTEGENYDNR